MKQEKTRRRTIEEIIQETSERTAEKVVRQQRRQVSTNHYRSMERLLRSYKTLQRLALNPDDYGFEPPQRSSSITVAPPPGGTVRDRSEVLEEAILARKLSYERTKARYDEIDAIVRQFADKPEFIVIRMYYFGEDARGQDRPEGSRPYSFEDISNELAREGVQRSEKTLRSWRTRIVQDMTVLLFGVDGALSIESREPKQGQKEDTHDAT